MSQRLRAIARETVDLVGAGRYRTPSGSEVDLAAGVAAAVAGTRLYLPTDDLPPPSPITTSPEVEVTNESTLAAARRLGGDVAALVFASARSPGGGFLNGAEAQEESIARASALYPCQQAAPAFYAHHRAERALTYSDRVIYSPAVPVFRDGSGGLLARPYPVTFLTAAAPNLSAIRNNQPERIGEVPAVLHRRAARVVRVAAAHGHRRLVLGAWGCGVFGNDPATVAGAFVSTLSHDGGVFEHVCFAVLDQQPGTPTYAAFARAFA